MKKKLCALLSAVMVFSLCVAPAHALELRDRKSVV